MVILDAHTLRLVRVLTFWEAFPGTQYTSDTVDCISVDSPMKIVRASAKSGWQAYLRSHETDSCVYEHAYRNLVPFWNSR